MLKIKSIFYRFMSKPLLGVVAIILLYVFVIPRKNTNTDDFIKSQYRIGLEVLLSDSLHLIENKSIALITNHTGINHDGIQNIELLLRKSGINLKTVYSPEHGFYGEAAAGLNVAYNQEDSKPYQMLSLYGDTRKPMPAMLKDVDLLIYDIQDIGARFYTYISTMGLAMEAAAESGIPIVILDRPNPVGGSLIEGPVLNLDFQSFIGFYPIPIRYAMTCGELANAIEGEKWIDSVPELIVIPINDWNRLKINTSGNESWMNPSPNIPDIETALLYLGTCLIEGTNLSEGRGTGHPFKWIGAPWINNIELSTKMNQLSLPGIEFKPVHFTPRSIPGVALHPKYQDEMCKGIEMRVTDYEQFRPVETGLSLVNILISEYPEDLKFLKNHLIKLLGSEEIFEQLVSGLSAQQILENERTKIEKFEKIREKYLIY